MNMLKKDHPPGIPETVSDETIMFLPLTEPEIKQIVVLPNQECAEDAFR